MVYYIHRNVISWHDVGMIQQRLTIWQYYIFICLIFMFQIVLYFLQSKLVLSFDIYVVLALSMAWKRMLLYIIINNINRTT